MYTLGCLISRQTTLLWRELIPRELWLLQLLLLLKRQGVVLVWVEELSRRRIGVASKSGNAGWTLLGMYAAILPQVLLLLLLMKLLRCLWLLLLWLWLWLWPQLSLHHWHLLGTLTCDQ